MAELPLFILYGSATGNAEFIAKDLASKCSANVPKPFTNVICCEGNAFKKKCLPIWEKAPSDESLKYGTIVVISTTGNGDAPENASRFTRYFKRKNTIEAKPLSHVAFSVLALGDSNYDKFCAAGELVNRKFVECGATRVQQIAMADEGTGLEDVVEKFVNNIIPIMVEACQKTESLNAVKQENDGGKEEKKEEIEEVNLTEKVESNSSEIPEKNNKSISKNDNAAGTPDGLNDMAKACSKDSLDIFSFSGVTMVKNIIAFTSNEAVNKVNVPKVCEVSLPTAGSALASCKFVVDDNKRERCNSTEVMASEIDRMTISSASSSNIHYTLNHPYESKILNAKYLTKTPLVTAKEVTNSNKQISTSGSMANDEQITSAMKQFEKSFALQSEKNVQGESDADEFERNSKRVIELTLQLPDDFTLEYEPGDSIGLLATNSPQSVQFVLSFLKGRHSISASQLISISEKEPMTVDGVVRNYIDLCSPIKSKKVLASLAQYATDNDEIDALNLLASTLPIGQELFRILVDEQRLTVFDILRLFPSCQAVSIEGLLAILPRIPPRYYSICSSPLKEGMCRSLKVALSVVNYMTPSLNFGGKPQRRVAGLVTTYLEAICSPFLCNEGTTTTTTVKIFPKPTSDFRLPSNLSTPMVLIGPGTGIAPFIGFLEHRQAQIAAQNEVNASMSEGTWRGGFKIQEEETPKTSTSVKQKSGDVDLYFGCRHSDHDWLYEDQMKLFVSQNIVSQLHVAFSRQDKNTKCYVQDKIKENAHHLAEMIVKKSANIYICGDGNSMAKGVQAALQDTLDEYFSENEEGIEKLTVDQLKAENRLLMDIWS